jgi:hypothetical protein
MVRRSGGVLLALLLQRKLCGHAGIVPLRRGNGHKKRKKAQKDVSDGGHGKALAVDDGKSKRGTLMTQPWTKAATSDSAKRCATILPNSGGPWQNGRPP